MPTRKPKYIVVVSPEEKTAIEQKRAALHMGISEFFRTSALHAEIIMPDQEQATRLLRMCHDLRRIGNLYRMELSNSERFEENEASRASLEKDRSQIMALADRIEKEALRPVQ